MSMQDRQMLPTFQNPPLEEVALSVQFQPINGLGSMHLGLLWRKMRSKYPKTSEQPPISATFETFGPRSVESSSVRFEALQTLPLPRFWMESEDGSELFQFQQDRAIHNWRTRENVPYPRFDAVKSRLVEDLNELQSFLKEEDLGEIEPNQCETTYINFITFPDERNPHKEMHLITNLVNKDENIEKGLYFDSQSLSTRYEIRSHDEPVGRLYASFTPIIIVSNQKIAVKLEITVRGRPEFPTISSSLEFIESSRCQIVETFDRITSPIMHAAWGKTEL